MRQKITLKLSQKLRLMRKMDAVVTVLSAYHAVLPLEAVTFVVDVYLLSNNQ